MTKSTPTMHFSREVPGTFLLKNTGMTFVPRPDCCRRLYHIACPHVSSRRNLLVLIVFTLWQTFAFAGGGGGQNTLTPLTNATVCPGANATFTTTPGGPTPYSFKWLKNGTIIPGKTTNTLRSEEHTSELQ